MTNARPERPPHCSVSLTATSTAPLTPTPAVTLTLPVTTTLTPQVLGSGGLPALTMLDVTGNRFTDKGLHSLAKVRVGVRGKRLVLIRRLG